VTTAGQLLREARERAALTQRELAEACGITQSVVSAYESGHREPTLPMLRRLVAGTGLRVELDLSPAHQLPRHGHGGLLRRRAGAVRAVLKRHGVRHARVFGSAARGDDGPESDIDLVVDMPPGSDLVDLSALALELEELLGVRVDVVPASSLRPGVAAEVERDAVPL
jgi:predicted nucleotidyltransferase/DNA-binding XRE family transcriptional regulator